MRELLYLKDDQLKQFIERMFIGYQATFSDARKTLKNHSLGVAHHKVILLMSIYEGITISQLMKKLKITKQSLNRVIKDLQRQELFYFRKDSKDSRLRRVFLNEKGKKVFSEIFNVQKKRFERAFLKSTSQEVLYFESVLKKIINE